MKLIDKAKLMNHIKGFLGIKSPSRVFMEKFDIEWDDVENAPTVEAIPIQFLKDWSEQNEYDETKPRTIPLVLSAWEDWRKEND